MRKTLALIILLFCIISLCVSRYIYATTIENLIVIDPGHGGVDGGCVGKDGTEEKNINLEVSLILKEALEKKGFNVVMTRDGDYDLASKESENRKREDIHKRVKIINESGAKLYLSIHVNYYPNAEISGSQVFFKKGSDNSKVLGVLMQNSLKEKLGNTKRFAKEINDKYLVDNVNIPGVLIEIGFLSNKEELLNLKNGEYQKRLSEAICSGVVNYLNL